MAKTTFQWDPDVDQTYSDDADLTLPGSAGSFSKTPGKKFTIDAPARTLALQVTPSSGETTAWGNSSSSLPTVFDIAHGTLVYDARSGATELSLGLYPTSEMTLNVRNDAKIMIMGALSQNNGLQIMSSGFLNISVEDAGSVFVPSCEFFGLSATETSLTNITLSGGAKMLVNSAVTFQVRNATVKVNSSSGRDLSLQWYIGIPGDEGQMLLSSTTMSFSGETATVLAGPSLTVNDTRITASDATNSQFGFGSITPTGSSQFILGPGAAQMQFDGQGRKQPFDFENGTYPEGIFQIESQGVVNGGEFVIQDSSGTSGTKAMLNRGLIAIDGIVQMDDSRLNFTYEGGYTHIKQKK